MTKIQHNANLREDVLNHFDAIASEYDRYKKNSEYYYNQLKLLLHELSVNNNNKRILEIGCGTGQLLLDLNPLKGQGIDISPNMIALAKENCQSNVELYFETGEAETYVFTEPWDIVVMSDVIEHLYDTEASLSNLASQMNVGSRLIITWANSLWEPILHLLEKLNMKMPEGAHNWENRKTVLQYLKNTGFTIEREGTRCLVPARIPLADAINNNFFKVSGLKNLGLIRFIVAVR